MPARHDSSDSLELVIRFGDWINRTRLGAQPLVLGRSVDCDVHLPDSNVSRTHCRLVPAGDGQWLVEDLGSNAGTLVDGARLDGPAPLEPGARLRIGPFEATLERRSAFASALTGDPARDGRNVELLLRTVGDLYGSETVDALLRTIVDRAIALAGGERGALLLGDGSHELEAAVARDAAGHDLATGDVLSRSAPERALETRQAVVLTDVEAPGQREHGSKSMFQKELRTVLCVPLPGTSSPIGVLYIDSRRPAEAFGPAELAVLEALAVQAALAIERARLREEQTQRDRVERRGLRAENAALRARLGAVEPIGESAAMRHALDLLRRVAPSSATVCLLGETGTGKEVLARWVHRLSPRADGPFVAIDCGAIPEGLIESELFGHERGAFTGATAAREGLFRQANGGTVFLDEIAELPAALQTRLLRVLQERTVQPVGGSARLSVDVRVVCATHRDLEKRVAEGLFREDLYYRIAVLPIAVPPLRERGEDVVLLARAFLRRLAEAQGSALTGFTREALDALVAHRWPGNVRELENCIQRAVLLAEPPFVSQSDLGLGGRLLAPSRAPSESDVAFLPLQAARSKASDRFERAYVEEALGRTRGNVTQAAALTGVSTQMLWRLIRKHGIERQQFEEKKA